MTGSCAATVVTPPQGTATTMRAVLSEQTRRAIDVDSDDAVIIATDAARLIARVHGGRPCGSHTESAVGLNSLHRETLGIDLDEPVRVESCTPVAATAITIQADAPMCRPFGPENTDTLRKALYHRPLLPGARFWLMSEACQQFGVIPGEWHPLRVVGADPDRPVYIDEQTTIQTPQRRFHIPDSGSEREAGSPADPWEAVRARVLARDERTCQNPRCSDASTDLQVHFVVPARTRGAVDAANLVTLCRECHEATHRRRARPTR